MTIARSPSLTSPNKQSIVYPDSDGEPMANNTKQFRWLVMLEGNLELLFADNPNVFVIGDLLWYPVEGNNQTRMAPDVMVAFGRPKGDRGSYLQWVEANIPPQVVFEILSPGNRKQEMADKFAFYERYGVEEYYLYDPDRGQLQGWLRDNEGKLTPIAPMRGWRSPRLGITFGLDGLDLLLYHPDGSRFLSFLELAQRREEAEERALAELLTRTDLEESLTAAEQRIETEILARQAAEQRAQAETEARAAAEAQIRQLEAKLSAAGLL